MTEGPKWAPHRQRIGISWFKFKASVAGDEYIRHRVKGTISAIILAQHVEALDIICSGGGMHAQIVYTCTLYA